MKVAEISRIYTDVGALASNKLLSVCRIIKV